MSPISSGRGGVRRVVAAAVVTATVVVVGVHQPANAEVPAHGFTDVPPGAYYEDAAAWLKHTGITTGLGNPTTFAPNIHVTRAQMAAFLWRMMDSPAVAGEHAATTASTVKNAKNLSTSRMIFSFLGVWQKVRRSETAHYDGPRGESAIRNPKSAIQSLILPPGSNTNGSAAV